MARKSQVEALKEQVATLKAANSKLKRKVARLETRLEAEDLDENSGPSADGDNRGQAMQDMLERLRGLMEQTTIGEEEECSICMDTLKVNEASSLPCDHVYCTECLVGLSKSTEPDHIYDSDGEYTMTARRFPCPACRKNATLADAQIVKLTETSRWNSLLEISVEFARLEQAREQDEADTEAGSGAEFGGDSDEESEAEEGEFRPRKRKLKRVLASIESDDEGEAGSATPPPQPNGAQSGSPEKRQKLQDLAEARARSKRR